MNGLLGWALREIGFDVTRMNGGVRREQMGDVQLGNHLVLRVQLDEQYPWLVDVGFGDGLFEPVPIKAARHHQRGFDFELTEVDGFWRLTNHPFGGAGSFDFKMDAADEALFAEKCKWLSTSDESPFVMNFICQRFVKGGYEIQVGRLARFVGPQGVEERLLDTSEEFAQRLEAVFELDIPETESLWQQVCERHRLRFE